MPPMKALTAAVKRKAAQITADTASEHNNNSIRVSRGRKSAAQSVKKPFETLKWGVAYCLLCCLCIIVLCRFCVYVFKVSYAQISTVELTLEIYSAKKIEKFFKKVLTNAKCCDII